MKYFFSFFLVLFFLFSCKKQEPTELFLTKGISLELAKYRKQQVDDVVYQLDFNIPKEEEKPILSKLILVVTVKDISNNLYLDFNEATASLTSISVNGKQTNITHKKEHIIIDKELLRKGKNTIVVYFNAGELSLNRNKDFLYTLLVPDRASTLFPCFDQPDIKANYQLNITAPKDWKVLCGAFKEKEIEGDFFTQHLFKPTDKMSTYLFSFVAGKFTEEIKTVKDFEMRFLYRENNEEKIAESVDKIFNIHQQSISFLEEYTKFSFPFQKMDFVSIPPFQYGGMEHVGAIQYRESALFLDKNSTQNKLLNRAKLIAHETSHMWFGNLVTMRWFNDVWMKEVFANFMADKIMNPVFPKINHTLSFMMSHYPSAYSEDRTRGTNAIRQHLGNLKNAGSLYGRIIYNKAPIMMRQLEDILGKEKFKEGIQEYIKVYANDNADWNELVAILDKKSPKDIKKWSDIWVNSSGRPLFSHKISYDEHAKISSFVITQKAEDGSSHIWGQSFDIDLIYDDEIKSINAVFLDKKLVLEEAIGLEKPNQIMYNSNGFGYGVFPIDKQAIDKYKNTKNKVARGYQYINLYESMLNSAITPIETYLVFIEAIKKEKNELISGYLSSRIETIFWTFLSEEEKIKVQKITEASTLSLLRSSQPANIKRVLFGLYQSIAISPEGKEKLYHIWNKKESIENLFLNENEYASLAMKLAVFGHPKSTEILKEQQTRISNSDRLERFRWLLPSVSSDNKVRDDFMKSLLKKENREKESWVQTALGNIHHPLRQKSSTKHLKSILGKLKEVQLTGDIFFPKIWLAHSIGKYSSKEALSIVTDFLAENPDYSPILKKKLLQTTDNLYRSQIIKHQK